MFGLDTLDIVIGLVFVYLILSLVVSALNEYLAGLTNRRGRVLREGIEALLKDRHVADAVTNHRLFQGLTTGRLPSYVPARTFAMSLLDVLGYEAGEGGRAVKNAEKSQRSLAAAAPGDLSHQSLDYVIGMLKQDSTLDLMEFVSDPRSLEGANLPEPLRAEAMKAMAGARTEFQKLHDSVEVWFNNGMDRVSGTYKRKTQVVILVIGALVTLLTNADTISIWQKLASSDAVRAGLVAQATAQAEEYARVAADPANPSRPSVDSALARFDRSVDQLNRTGLQFGWGSGDLRRLGFEAGPPLSPAPTRGQIIGNWISKVIGLLMTIVALSLGAPFWFDALNKIINIRSTGRAPDEKAKSPEAPGKRLAEQPTK